MVKDNQLINQIGEILNDPNPRNNYAKEIIEIYPNLLNLALKNNTSLNIIDIKDIGHKDYLFYAEAFCHKAIYERLPDVLNITFTKNIHCADAILLWNYKIYSGNFSSLYYSYCFDIPIIFLENSIFTNVVKDSQILSPLSIMIDNKSVYLDHDRETSLENQLNSDWKINDDEYDLARQACQKIYEYGLSKFNLHPFTYVDLSLQDYESIILCVDQTTEHDHEEYQSTRPLFQQMLKDAVNDNPNSIILIKSVPDVQRTVASDNQIVTMQGYFNDKDIQHPRIRFLKGSGNVMSLLKAVDKVYTVRSFIGLEAALCNKEVYCYGGLFCNGWGFTIDCSDKAKTRIKSRSLYELFYLYFIQNTIYFNPETFQRLNIMEAIEYIHYNISHG